MNYLLATFSDIDQQQLRVLFSFWWRTIADFAPEYLACVAIARMLFLATQSLEGLFSAGLYLKRSSHFVRDAVGACATRASLRTKVEP